MRYGQPFLFGNELARVFGLTPSQSLILRTHNSTLAVTHLVSSSGQLTPTKPIAPEQGFAIPVQLANPDAANWGLWVDGRYTPTPKWQQGGIGIYDLESDPRIHWDTPFEALCFNVPRATLNAFTEDAGLANVNGLINPEGLRDPVLHHLAQMIVPFIREGNVLPGLFVDHFLRMLCGRLAISYGDGSSTGHPHRGGFAPWQMRRVPYFRERKAGQFIQFSSMGGRIGPPGRGPYSAAKWGVEGFSEVLSREVAPLGIKVTIVEPGGFRTDFAGSSTKLSEGHPEYDSTVGATARFQRNYNGKQPGDPKKAAQAIIQLSQEQKPPLRLLLGSDAYNGAEKNDLERLEEARRWKQLSLSTDFEAR